ncbi:MAG TPA: GNAT family N-acetyltransferase [Acidimicrobiales bacterium]|nr:GNAT family N-acetyltransferase [Acidimicrobiales bacterium]
MAERLVLTTLDDGRWAHLLERAPGVTPFHHPAWARLLADCYRFDAVVAGLVDADGVMTAGLPLVDIRHRAGSRRWVSLPFTDACAPVATDATTLTTLVRELDGARADAGVAHVEVRAALPPPAAPLASGAVIHRRSLPGSVDELWATTHKSRRTGVRTARNKGVTVRPARQRDDLTGHFYDLHVATRRRHGVPVQPKRFFELLWDRVVVPGLGVVLVAEVEGAPIAAAVYLEWRGTMVCKFGASDPAHWQRRANDLLMWESFTWAIARDATEVDFGRSDLENAGLGQHKRSWGGMEEPLVYSTIGVAGRDERGRLAHLAGPVLRHAPLWVTRATGRALYRRAA